MDSKDFRLLVALYENARQSYRSLGKRISLSAPAARDRLKRLEDDSILQGYWLYVDPAVFGRNDLMVFYNGDWKREDAVKALSADDVAFVAWKLKGGLSVQTWPLDRKKPIRVLTAVLGEPPSGYAFTEAKPVRETNAVDWQIIDALVDDPTIPFDELVENTGLSPKTVRKHLQSLLRDEIIFIMPRLGSLADSGELVYHLAVTGKVGLVELRRTLGEAYMISETHDPPMKYLLCRASDLADATSRIRAAGKVSGVESVEVTLNRELLVAKDFVHLLVQSKIKNWKTAAAS